jgi:uncharacterized membrane protein
MENSIYFTQVKVYLNQLTVDEQEDVIRFYQEYAADAQLSGERLISELGTPKQLARRILVDYSLRLEEDDIHNTYEHESTRQDRQNWIKQEFNLISIVLEGLLTSIVWVPAHAVNFNLFVCDNWYCRNCDCGANLLSTDRLISNRWRLGNYA